MKRILVLLFLLVPALAGPRLAAGATEDIGMVWKVTSPSATVYLAGSVHFLSFKDHPLPAPYQSAYEKAGKILFELDMREVYSPENMAVMQNGSILPEGTRIEDVLQPETLRHLEKYAEARGLPKTSFSRQQPWYAAVTITTIDLMRLGITPAAGVDMHFFQKSQQDGKPIRGLETIAFQVGLFTSMSMEEQDLFLQSTLIDIETLDQAMDHMTMLWRTGQEEELANYLHEGLSDFPDLVESLLHQRNRNWIEDIETLLQGDQTAMVIVGAGHLVGEQSVIELLQENDFKVERWK